MDQKTLEELFLKKPHLVILGAGATVAAIPNGDKNGIKCSVMNNFLQNIGKENLLDNVKLETQSKNLEDIYSELYEKGEKELCHNLEHEIYNYFQEFTLPDELTIYDLLVLSMRKKDCIASFNWDPLLIQARQRMSNITEDLPQMVFLHGNVQAGYCEKCGEFGYIKNKCHTCGQPFSKTPLLYPVKHKNYNENLFIREQWDTLEYFISYAAIITIFGYSAPKSDIEAIEIIEKAFSKNGKEARRFDSLEIIEKPGFNNEELSDVWQNLAGNVNYHLDIFNSFYDSILAKFPRRSIEGYTKRNISGWWGSSTISYSDKVRHTKYAIWKLVQPLLKAENKNDFSVIGNE